MIYAVETEGASWAANAFLISLSVAMALFVVTLIIQIIIYCRWM